MNSLVKVGRNKRYKVHAARDGRPLCGGGNSARRASWQLDLGDCNCRVCLALLARPAKSTSTHPTKP